MPKFCISGMWRSTIHRCGMKMRKIAYARDRNSGWANCRAPSAARPAACGKDSSARPQLEEAIDKFATGDIRVLGNGTGVHITKRFHVRGALLMALDKPHQDLAAPLDHGFTAFPGDGVSAAAAHRQARKWQQTRQSPRRHKSGQRQSSTRISTNRLSTKRPPKGGLAGRERGSRNVLTLPVSRLR